MNHNQLRDQAIVAREIIDIYYQYKNHADIIEYLSRICFSQARLLDGTQFETTSIDWHGLFDFFDQRYYALKHGSIMPKDSIIDAISLKVTNCILSQQAPHI